MTKLHQFAIMCAPTVSQYAAIEAMKSCDEEIERMAVQDLHPRPQVLFHPQGGKVKIHRLPEQGSGVGGGF